MKQISIYFFTIISISTILYSCGNKSEKTDELSISTIKEPVELYQSLKFVDSFIKINKKKIDKNNILKNEYEALCTKKILPLIEKKGLYDDLPFELAATITNNNKVYGNFIYSDEKFYVKVTCIINKSQIKNLEETKKYFIKFNIAQFENGVTFENEFSVIELPTVNGYLKSFTPVVK